MSQTSFAGVHHVALNVRDLDESVRWYTDNLDFSLLIPFNTDDFDRRLMGHASGMYLALTKHKHPDAGSNFNARITGLDHLAFGVASIEELEAWAVRLASAGIENSGVQVTPGSGFTLVDFKDPNGIQLELYLA